MEGPKLKSESGNYDKVLYTKLLSFQGRRCKLILKDGHEVEGGLNYVSIGISGEPFIVFDMGDQKISVQYNLDFDNIADVVGVE
jgi:hypothetical protein